jgi:hypothetical protein
MFILLIISYCLLYYYLKILIFILTRKNHIEIIFKFEFKDPNQKTNFSFKFDFNLLNSMIIIS